MKRVSRIIMMLLVAMSAPMVSFANGGGGIEYVTNAGSDVLGKSLFGGSFVDLPTGSIAAISAFGYGVTIRGWKIGGFGTGAVCRMGCFLAA